MPQGTDGLLFAGLTTSPAREFVAERLDPDLDRVDLPCVGRWAIATAVAKKVDPSKIYASDLSLFSTIIGYLADPTKSLADLDLTIPDRVAAFVPDGGDDIRTASGILLATKYLMLTGAKAYNAAYRREVWVNRDSIRGKIEDALREQVDILGGVHYENQDVRDVVAQFIDRGNENDAMYVNLPGYCLAPWHRVLTADLRWVPVSEVAAGDVLLTFEEHAAPGNKNRRWTETTVLRSDPAMKECVRVTLADGTEIVCSADHPWLAETVGSVTQPRRYVEAADLTGKTTAGRSLGRQSVLRLLDTWEPAETYDTGWLAGMYDGEGHVSIQGVSPKVAVTQTVGPILDRIQRVLADLGFDAAVRVRDRQEGRKKIANVDVVGGMPEALRLLGTVRPGRLIENLRAQGYAKRQARVTAKVEVVSVEHIGMHPVQSIETDAHTYVGEGFAMHNSGGYFKMYGEAEKQLWTCKLEVGEFHPDEAAPLLQSLSGAAGQAFAYIHHGDDTMPDDWTKQLAIQVASDRTDYIVTNQDRDGARLAVGVKYDGQPRRFPIFSNQEIHPDSVIEFVEVDKNTCLYYRDLFVHRLGTAKAERFALMTIDGRVTTAFGLMFRDLLRGADQYVAEVFGISTTSDRYGRLGKLFMLALTSGEFKRWAKRTWPTSIGSAEPRGIKTASPTVNHEGKTDRGVLELVRREPRPGGGFQLLYVGDFRDDNLNDVLQRWLATQGHITRPGYTPKESVDAAQ